MAKILLKLDAKYIQRHASVARDASPEFARAEDALDRLGADAHVEENQFLALYSLVAHGLTIEIDRTGKYHVINKT